MEGIESRCAKTGRFFYLGLMAMTPLLVPLTCAIVRRCTPSVLRKIRTPAWRSPLVSPRLYEPTPPTSSFPPYPEPAVHRPAPEIYGHVDVKKALLLQLVGGVSK